MTQQTANNVLMGGGNAPPRALFDLPGKSFGGRIVHISEPYQEREYDQANPGGGDLKFFKSGDPIMTFNVDIATDLRDPAIEDDDGTRRIYMDGARIKEATRNAIRAAGASGLEVGGWVKWTYVSDKVEGDHRSGKNWEVEYRSAANTALMGATPSAPPTPAPAATPAASPAAAVPAAASPAATAKELITAGLNNDDIAAATGLSITTVVALRNAPQY